MAAAIRHAGTNDREVCRQTARDRFSADRMLRDYFAIYRRLAEGYRSREADAGYQHAS
jgi:hypothetical protein